MAQIHGSMARGSCAKKVGKATSPELEHFSRFFKDLEGILTALQSIPINTSMNDVEPRLLADSC